MPKPPLASPPPPPGVSIRDRRTELPGGATPDVIRYTPSPYREMPAPYDTRTGDWQWQDQWLPSHFSKAAQTPVHMTVPGGSRAAWMRGLGERGAAGVYGGGSTMITHPDKGSPPEYLGNRVYPHETGHAAWFQDLDPFDQQRWLALQSRYPQERGPSEGFADAFRDYTMNPEWLRTNHPEVHNFMFKIFGGATYPQQGRK